MRVQTDPPTVCAIAYGRTASLGSIATIPAWAAPRSPSHTVVLGGLTPSTTYRFRLTATDAKGSVFQTRAADHLHDTPSTAGRHAGDIASARRSSPSARSGADAYRAANAVDGNLSTEWASAGDGDRAFITIDLGQRRHITGVAFRTREMSDGSSITRTFAVVVDGGKRYGPFPAGNRLDPRTRP